MIRIFHPIYGVPITYLGCHCVEQFKIVGEGRNYPMSEQFVSNYYKSGGKGSYKAGNPLLGYYDQAGKAKIPYMRILIKKYENKN